MKVVILGSGRVGARVATELSKAGHDVTIIDMNSNAFRRLGAEYRGKTVVGTGIDSDILRKAGIETADVFMSVTNGDNTNLMTAQVAKDIFRVKKVITRIYDPERARAYKELGLETICSTVIMADKIQETIGKV